MAPTASSFAKNNEPGNGDNNSGDVVVGYINRGLNWNNPKETADRYEVFITADAAAGDLPLSVDVTPRRCQTFKLPPGQTCEATNVDAAGQTIQSMPLKADRWGLVKSLAIRTDGKPLLVVLADDSFQQRAGQLSTGPIRGGQQVVDFDPALLV